MTVKSGHGRGHGRAHPEGAERFPARSRAPARGASVLLGILMVIGSFHALFMIGVEGYRTVQRHQAISRLEEDVHRRDLEAARLEAEIAHGSDHAYREQLARRQGFIYPNEVRVLTFE